MRNDYGSCWQRNPFYSSAHNPDAAMKDSGIEWLGMVPAHWEVHVFRRAIDLLTDFEANGSFAAIKAKVQIDTGEPFAWYVRATDLEKNELGLNAETRFCNQASYQNLPKTALYGGELLVTKRGEIGKVYVMPSLNEPATLAPNLYLIKLNGTMVAEFAHAWFSSNYGRPQLELANKSTTIGALYKDDVAEMKIPFPPVEEQKGIVVTIRNENKVLDRLAAEATSAIKLLHERRSALISAAVTGKIDVRGLVEGKIAA